MTDIPSLAGELFRNREPIATAASLTGVQSKALVHPINLRNPSVPVATPLRQHLAAQQPTLAKDTPQ